MIRLPELRDRLEDAEAPSDDSIALEVEELTRSVPKLIGVLTDALRDRTDVRHNAALTEMISGLTVRLDQLRPLAVSSSLFLYTVPPPLTNAQLSLDLKFVLPTWLSPRNYIIFAQQRMKNSCGLLKLYNCLFRSASHLSIKSRVPLSSRLSEVPPYLSAILTEAMIR